jgi:TrpR-related protein YerC/YecD
MSEAKDKQKKWLNQDTDDLFEAILKLENLGEARRFFRDLLTEKEIVEFGQRWKVARMLAKQLRYTEIEKKTGMSSTTIARVHKWLKEGMGGYQIILKRLKEGR